MDFSQSFSEVLKYEETALGLFDKKNYASAYDDFKKSYADTLKQLNSDAKDACMNDIISIVSDELASYKGFRVFQKSEVLRKHNLYMVAYILPFLIEIDESQVIANELAKMWGDSFKNSNITAASFDEINSGFVTKLFGMIVQND